MIEAVCPNGHRLHVPAEHAGMKLRCPACNSIFQLNAAPGGAAPNGGAAAGAPATSGAIAGSAAPTAAAPAEAAGGRWSGSDATTGNAAPSTPASPPPAAAPARAPSPAAFRTSGGTATLLHGTAYLLLIFGLLTVLSARGCEGVATKNVARLQARVDLAQRDFDMEREQEQVDLQAELDDKNTTASRRSEVQKRLDDLPERYDKRRRELQNGDWRVASNDAARATAENRSWAYWRELMFLGGTLLFSLGLMMTAYVGQAAERWASFAMLAIIVFSIYIGGLAWSAAIGIGR